MGGGGGEVTTEVVVYSMNPFPIKYCFMLEQTENDEGALVGTDFAWVKKPVGFGEFGYGSVTSTDEYGVKVFRYVGPNEGECSAQTTQDEDLFNIALNTHAGAGLHVENVGISFMEKPDAWYDPELAPGRTTVFMINEAVNYESCQVEFFTDDGGVDVDMGSIPFDEGVTLHIDCSLDPGATFLEVRFDCDGEVAMKRIRVGEFCKDGAMFFTAGGNKMDPHYPLEVFSVNSQATCSALCDKRDFSGATRLKFYKEEKGVESALRLWHWAVVLTGALLLLQCCHRGYKKRES
mmetsp:Transcript_35016/g.110122  ORF Transcript_35016/g.110122 Transcript_35016/m.110122 type:complete len:292 (-) Transcript_35016:374-1249(-)